MKVVQPEKWVCKPEIGDGKKAMKVFDKHQSIRADLKSARQSLLQNIHEITAQNCGEPMTTYMD